MERAKVICHMMTTIDGKISIDWDGNADYNTAGETYDALIYEYGQAYGCGRATCQYLPESDLSAYKGKPVAYQDRVVQPQNGEFITVAFDRYGKLRFSGNTSEYGGRVSRMVVVTTEQAKPEYLAYLCDNNIAYLIAGKENFDPLIFLEKLKAYYGVDTFVLCGGAGINAAFMEADLVDEISLVIGAAVDGTRNALTFVGGEQPAAFPKYFHFKEMERVGQDGIILRYIK